MRVPLTAIRTARVVGMLLLVALTLWADSGVQPPAEDAPSVHSFPLPEKIRLDIREKQLALQQLTAQMLEAQLLLERGAAQIATLRDAIQKALEAAAREHKCQQVTETLLCVPVDASKSEPASPSKQQLPAPKHPIHRPPTTR